MAKITNPNLLQQLEAPKSGQVTDQAVLDRLEPPPMTPEQAALIAPEPAPVDYGKALENAPGSLVAAAEDVLMPIYRTGEFAEGLKNLFIGATESLGERDIYPGAVKSDQFKIPAIERFVERNPEFARDTEKGKQVFQAAMDYYKGYADEDTRKRRFEEDPAGVVLDALAVGTGGIMGAGKFGGASRRAIGDMPERMMEEAAKFPSGGTIGATNRLTNDEVKDLVNFMLEEKIELSTEGLEHLGNLTETLADDVDRMIAEADKGQKIKRRDLNKVLERMSQETIGKTSMSSKQRNAIQKVIDAWEKEIEFSGEEFFTLPELQQFKRDNYQLINWSRSDSVKKNTTIHALKEQALDAKRRIAHEVPGVSEQNTRLGTALELNPMLERSVKRIDRNSGAGRFGFNMAGGTMSGAALDALLFQMGIPPGFATAAGGLYGAAKTAAGAPKRKASIAQALYDYRKKRPMIDENTALLNAMMAGTYPQALADQNNSGASEDQTRRLLQSMQPAPR